ncbi:META domain-containing protein [Streptomyces sp. NPDC006367]|uniref:META domain-containing protein n=1 Tax=unclassified Streptomyces TaxID=2593676 RepID=UPI00339F6BE1
MYRQKQKQQRSMTLTVAAVAVLVPLAAACGSEKAGGSGSVGAGTPVTGVRWSIDSVTVDGTTHQAPDSARVRIDDGGEASGSTGCNTFGARATVDGDRVRLSDATFTEKGCTDTPAGFEKSLGHVLGAELTARAHGERLTLTTPDGDTVELSRERDAPLYGTKWALTEPGPKGRAHLTFDRDAKSVSGRLPCNRVSAGATVSDGHITLGTPATTRMMCEGSLMDAEKRTLRLFEGRAEYRIVQDTLTLTSEDGVTVRAVADR